VPELGEPAASVRGNKCWWDRPKSFKGTRTGKTDEGSMWCKVAKQGLLREGKGNGSHQKMGLGERVKVVIVRTLDKESVCAKEVTGVGELCKRKRLKQRLSKSRT